ncbi:MAG TPA: methyltransferase domain-containing protein, partial [Bryobacteraceae bacterium]|nr:methyltransferase domain-containing protein [Bryobacteraceae bacterium]
MRDSDAYRLAFSEADSLPGLIVDRYGSAVTLQTQTQGMDRARLTIVEVLRNLLNPSVIVSRNDAAVRRREQLPQETLVEAGEWTGAVQVAMNGLSWSVDLPHGQKTGIYLDQRENYAAVARHAHGQALDCFTSTGGFAIHMARTCESVEAVDSSAQALATARENADRNGITNIRWREADAFDLLAAHAR